MRPPEDVYRLMAQTVDIIVIRLIQNGVVDYFDCNSFLTRLYNSDP